MTKLFLMLYGTVSYLIGVASLVLFILFANNHIALFGIPELAFLAIDIGNQRALLPAIAVNMGLLLLFAIQHSVMARPNFKAKLTQIIPAAAERSTYVLATGVVTIALVAFWAPLTNPIWRVDNDTARLAIDVVYFTGWTITFLATFMINHFHLFGLQQSFRSSDPDAGAKAFVTPYFYKLVRHPIQTGIVIAMVATPDMTLGRLILTIGMLVYVVIGLNYEERDLVAEFGDTYRDYMKRVPRLFPGMPGKSG